MVRRSPFRGGRSRLEGVRPRGEGASRERAERRPLRSEGRAEPDELLSVPFLLRLPQRPGEFVEGIRIEGFLHVRFDLHLQVVQFVLRRSREHDDGDIRPGIADLGDEFFAVHPRKVQVEQDRVRARRVAVLAGSAKEVHRVGSGRDGVNGRVSRRFSEQFLRQSDVARIILHEEDVAKIRRGTHYGPVGTDRVKGSVTSRSNSSRRDRRDRSPSSPTGPNTFIRTDHERPTVIVVATSDFEVYHGVVNELRDRGTEFTTVEPDEQLPDRTAVVITGADHADDFDGVTTIVAAPDEPRRAVDQALTAVRGDGGRTIIGVDPGRKPGIAVLAGEMIVAAFQVPLADAVDVIQREAAEAPDPVVRIGDGSRLESARLVNDLEEVRVELVDETGTTPYLGTGARGTEDVLAAVNIARLEGEVVDTREIEPTAGELQVIKDRSREQSEHNRAIDEVLARRVAAGELTIEEALAEHRSEDDEPTEDAT